MNKIEQYKELIDQLEVFFKSKLDEKFSEWSLTYNDHHGCYVTLKDEHEDFILHPNSSHSILALATWVQGEADRTRAVEEDRVWELRYNAKDNGQSVSYAAATLLGLLSGLDFVNLTSVNAEPISTLESMLQSLLSGEYTDLAFRSRTYQLTDTVPPCKSFDELIKVLSIQMDEFSTPEEYDRFKQTHTEVEFTWYPNTPVGCHTVRGVELYSVLAAVFE